MRVLITGAAGFIGSFVTERFLDDGHEVVGLDNFDDFYDPRLKRLNLEAACSSSRFELIEGNFLDETVLGRIFDERPPQAIVHLGARAGVRPSLEQAPLYTEVNITGTVRLLEAARRSDVTKFVFASSSSVYGERPAKPFREDDSVDNPVSPYAATKKAGELLCYTYHHLFGLNICCLRFFTVYGPRQRPEMAIHKFTRAIDRGETIEVYGDGTAQRDFTFIDDIVDGIAASFERCHGYRIYNLGRGDTVELRRVIELIEAALGKKARVEFRAQEPGDVPVTFASIERAKAEIGYAPSVSIDEGVRRFVDWFRNEARETRSPRAT